MKKKKTIHLSKKRKRKDRVSLSVTTVKSDFETAALNRKTGNKKQTFFTFFSKYYGIGFNKIVNRILRFLGIGLNYKLKYYKWGKKNHRALNEIFAVNFMLIDKIKERKYENINLKQNLLIFISYRHLLNLPVRGQRTKTHAKTRKIFHVL